MASSSKQESSLDRDEQLAAVIARLTEQLRRGEAPDLNRAAVQHPDLADELRELWPAVLLAEELARPSDPEATIPQQSPITGFPSDASPLSLPRTFGDYELLEELGRGAWALSSRRSRRAWIASSR